MDPALHVPECQSILIVRIRCTSWMFRYPSRHSRWDGMFEYLTGTTLCTYENVFNHGCLLLSFSTYRLWHMQWAVIQGYSPLTFTGFCRCCSLPLSIGYRKYCILTQKACRFPYHTTVQFISGTIPQRSKAISGALPQRCTANIMHTTATLYG